MGKVNFKLINICLLSLIIFLLYKTSGLWVNIVNISRKMFIPFILAFLLAYALNPLIRSLKKLGIPKIISIILLLLFICLIIYMIATKVVPSLINNLFNEVMIFITYISKKYGFNINDFEIISTFNFFLSNYGKYISGSVINFVNIVLNYFSTFVIFVTSFIYFLLDMDKIRDKVFKYIHKKNETFSNLLENIDDEMVKYFSSFFKIMFITFFEYSLGFLIIGHPDFIILGLLASIASFIPCFGGIFVNILASITALVINYKLFIRVLIVCFILSLLDSNVINPLVYGKTNKIHPLITIFAVFAGGIIFKMLGIIISIPITIIVLTTYRFYKRSEKYATKT